MADESTVDVPTPEEPTSRRSMLRTVALGAGAAAAAGVAGVVAGAGSAGAADGAEFFQGNAATAGNTFQTPTNFTYDATAPAVQTSFTVQAGEQSAANNGILSGAFGAGIGTAFLGVANGNGPQQIGVIGWSKRAGGTGVIGFTGGAGAYGGEFFGGLAELRLRPNTDPLPPIDDTRPHLVGELYEDTDGTLWLCVVAGTPGSWRELGGPTSAGAFHAISPKRVYDSRGGAGKLQPTIDRTISVATSSGVTVVPPFSSAVAMTCTVTNTEGTVGGFVSVRPGGTPYEGTSSINWFGVDQNIGTTVISGISANREITLRAGENRTDFVVDVTGYYR